MDEPAFPPPTLPPTPPPSLAPALAPTLATSRAPVGAPTWVSVAPISATTSPAQRRRRRGPLAAFALIGLATAATAGVVLTREETADAYSLTVAATQAQSAQTVTYELEMSVGAMGQMSARVSLDVDRELMTMHLETDEIDMPVDAVFDIAANTMYMSTEPFAGMGVPLGDAAWIEFDLDAAGGFDMSALIGEMGDNPLDATAMFELADSVDDLGFDEVRGQRVKHYAVTVNVATALEAQPDLADTLTDMGAALPETLVYDAYVNEANQLIRLSYDYEVMGQQATMELIVISVDDAVEIEVPDASSVISLDDLGR